jgi:TatA/E family protein of Tat protein translocase
MITSIPDLVIIGGAALLVFGPKRLPELAKSLGKGIRDFKKAMDGGYDEAEVLPPVSKEALPSSVAQVTKSEEIKQPQPHA